MLASITDLFQTSRHPIILQPWSAGDLLKSLKVEEACDLHAYKLHSGNKKKKIMDCEFEYQKQLVKELLPLTAGYRFASVGSKSVELLRLQRLACTQQRNHRELTVFLY